MPLSQHEKKAILDYIMHSSCKGIYEDYWEVAFPDREYDEETFDELRDDVDDFVDEAREKLKKMIDEEKL
jgi:hypothetical protein